MDAVPKENLDLGQEKIVVPKDVAKAFGRGLRQSMDSAFQEINSCLPSLLMDNPKHGIIEGSVKRITNLLDRLEKAKEVKISILGAGDLGNLNDFVFSEETEDLDPKPGELLMDSNITPKFINALNHNVRNPLFIVSGFAEMSKLEEAKRIVNACRQIENVIKSLSDAQEIKIVTDVEGNTTITPIRNVT